MIDRYRNEDIREIFSAQMRYDMWRQVEVDYIKARRVVFGDESVTDEIRIEIEETPTPHAGTVEGRERKLGHDVMGFLDAWTEEMSNEAASKIHYGLTSSDLVDNTLFQQMYFAGNTAWELAEGLAHILQAMRHEHQITVRAGRTHGQKAEVTTWGWRCVVWYDSLQSLMEEWHTSVAEQVNVIKTPGGVGNMQILGDHVPIVVAQVRGATLAASTQVIPRQRMMAWAGWLLRLVSVCETIALEVRLSSRSETGEMLEGAAKDRVGSSAMPHKLNPIGSEQISGLARVARAYFASIAETAGVLHNERDISNSSVERIVVPDLAELTAYILQSTGNIVQNLQLDPGRMFQNAMIPRSSLIQARLQELGLPYMTANRMTRDWAETGGWDYGEIIRELFEVGVELKDAHAFHEAMGGTDFAVNLEPSKNWP